MVRNLLTLFLVLCLSGPGDFLSAEDEKNNNDKSQNEWIVEVRDGIKRYGKTSEFAAVGHSHAFDVSPTEKMIAFGSGDGIKIWDVEAKKVVRKLGKQYHQNMMYSGDGTKLVSTSYDEGKSVLKIYDAITGDEL
ncbi:MAG: hypothetical protein AAGA30_16415, partial [Planctomycetota bacterium]